MKKLITLSILFLSGIVSLAQTPDSCICYTDDMDKAALECLVNSPKKDSLIQNLSLQLYNTNQINQNLSTINIDLENESKRLNKENGQIKLNLQKLKNRTTIIGVGCFSIGVGATIFIFKKIGS
ncbi:MAG: hypothetical protein PHT69_02135 [Bacteroidales bacterium]|nr:hypothetical protein [Bacteroidales bacterium]